MENLNQNVILEKQLLPINCKKPSFTIQDSYMMFYFGGINLPTSEDIAIKNPSRMELKELKGLQKEIIASAKEASVNSSEKHSLQKPNDTTSLEKKIFSGKKTKRHDYSDSLDPLEILNIRDKKGNFVKDEKKCLFEKDEEEESNNEFKYINTNIANIPRSIYESASRNAHVHKSGDKYEDEDEDIVGIKKKEIEKDLLVPVSFRHKRKNK